MPDEWEIAHGLNPNNASDRNSIAPNGYTYLEFYLNSLVTSDNFPSHIEENDNDKSIKLMEKYDLSGKRLTVAAKGQIFIQNNKKYIQK